MDVSGVTTAIQQQQQQQQSSWEYEDWEDLKELFGRASERYENGEPQETMPILRAVIHECYRFLLSYPEPSELYLSKPKEKTTSTTETQTTEDQTTTMLLSPPTTTTTSGTRTASASVSSWKPTDLPTAFHVVLGTTLFMFGTLISSAPTFALPDEPADPAPYWLAALDVFESGETLPSHSTASTMTTMTSDFDVDTPAENWRLAIVWGRTLVAIASYAVSRSSPNDDFLARDPEWPPDSPFAAIAASRPLTTRRMSLAGTSPDDLMLLAVDQFSRGIFRMPHLEPSSDSVGDRHDDDDPHFLPPHANLLPFSRPREIYTLAIEVLAVAEHIPGAQTKRTWAQYADSVFWQMQLEQMHLRPVSWPVTGSSSGRSGTTTTTTTGGNHALGRAIDTARGRCWLVSGSSGIEDIETRLETEEEGVYDNEEVVQAREDLGKAVEFFEKVLVSLSSISEEEEGVGGGGEEEAKEVRSLLAEALLTLGNLTREEREREELYKRARVEGAGDWEMDEDEDTVMRDQ